ncbi:MAG: tRNA (adenosine(37)-N6)-threonylcarbamoyltransferase complex transferase subunit TsaD [Parachlamydiales bacterium]|nr:tRNA (adenosine(37)-N6)-threonylcarbamoyltransferase complex transferase subunit TsaD [Parachlamydiales bacterium]
MLVLGIESTCDETAASVVEDGEKILSNIIYSQIDLHKKYGGVFPEVASRSHVDKMIPVIDEALKKASKTLNHIDLIAVAKGPGLIGSLLVGLNTAKTLSLTLKKPFIGVNHIEAHLYASMMDNLDNLAFPSLGVVISGGHTMLLKIKNIGEYEKLSGTLDDAIGECFDKVASILELPYPGGPEIEKLAKLGDENKYIFNAGKIKDNPLCFSFSGLKTKVLYTVKGQSSKKDSPVLINEEEKKHIAASFQKCAFSDLIKKSFLAAEKFNLKSIYFGGGVSNNKTLRKMFFDENLKNLKLFWPQAGLSLDNAAMIAGLGYHKFKKSFKSDLLSLEAKTQFFEI